MSDPEGRRIYIARNSLRDSVTKHGGAYAVSYALAATRGARIVSHNLEDPFSPARQMVRPQVATKILEHLITAREGTLDELFLKRIGYAPKCPQRSASALPLYGKTEATFATCYDSDNNWYTVATGAAAAERMWQDDEPVDSLLARLSVPADELPEDIRDLTVITAEDELFPVVCTPDGSYNRLAGPRSTAGLGSRREARTIDQQTRNSYLRYLGDVGLQVYHEQLEVADPFTTEEMRVLGDTFAACRNSLHEYASY
jgi:hypothetical protein